MSGGYVYILGSHTGALYIGVTNLYLRVMQHKAGTLEGFTSAHGCNRLLYFEGYEDIRTAIDREKQLKGWRREKKLNLIGTINPEFNDLAHLGMEDDYSAWKDVPLTIKWVPQQDPVLGLWWSKGSERHG
jgi:putative endonuclease